MRTWDNPTDPDRGPPDVPDTPGDPDTPREPVEHPPFDEDPEAQRAPGAGDDESGGGPPPMQA